MDYSSMSKLLSCARSYEYSEVARLAPLESRRALSFGHAWHALLQQYGSDKQFFTDLDAGVEAMLALLKWEDPIDDYRTAAKLKRGLRAWIDRYAESPYQYLETESSYTNELVRGLEPQEGRIDAIVRWDANQGKGRETWVVDYKTASLLRGDWVEFYRNSNQFRYYFLSQRARLPELAGVVVDVYHATKGVQKGKTQEERDGNRFYRLPIRYEEFQLEEAVRDYGVAVVTKQVFLDAGYFPRNTSACHQFGGACPFLELCDAHSPESRDRIASLFGENTFNVHAPLELGS